MSETVDLPTAENNDFDGSQKLIKELKLKLEEANNSKASLKKALDVVKTRRDYDVNNYTNMLDEHDEMIEDLIDVLYDYEETLRENRVKLKESAADAFEDAKVALNERVRDKTSTSSLWKVKDLIRRSEKYNALEKKYDKLTEDNKEMKVLLEEALNQVGSDNLSKSFTKMKKEIAKYKALLKEALNNGLGGESTGTPSDKKTAAQIKLLKKKNLRLKEDNKNLQTLLKDASNALGGSSSSPTALQKLQEENRKLKKENSNNLKLLKEVSDGAMSKEDVAHALNGDKIHELEQENERLLKELQGLKEGGQSSQSTNVAVSADDKKSSKRISELEKEIKDLKLSKRNASDVSKANDEATSKLKGQLSELQEVIESLESDVANAESKKKDAENKMKECEAKMTKLQEKLKGGNARFAKAGRKIGSSAKLVKESANGIISTMRDQIGSFAPFVKESLVELGRLAEGQEKVYQNALKNYRREFALRKKIYNELQELRGNIRILVRVRPLLPFEKKDGRENCVSYPALDQVCIYNDKKKRDNTWEFDTVFGEESSNMDVYKSVEPLVTSVLDGFNVCIFAYGQTGAGKTYSMNGTEDNLGVIWLTLNSLFKLKGEQEKQFDVKMCMSLMEIYNEVIRDLLDNNFHKSGKKLSVKMIKNDLEIPGLTILDIENLQDIKKANKKGTKNRATDATAMNSDSSRSHSILTLYIESINRLTKKTSFGKLHLIDLAGSERLAKSKAVGARAKEAAAINKSLSALGDVIQCLSKKSKHIPFRNSTLTHCLADSLGGNSKVMMIAQVSPADYNAGESYCTLNFASRARSVELGKAKANVR